MASPEWWYTFLKHAKAINKTGAVPDSFTDRLNTAIQLFHLYTENPEKLLGFGQKQVIALLVKTFSLYQEVQNREQQTSHPSKRSFYNTFAKSIAEGIESIKEKMGPDFKFQSGLGSLNTSRKTDEIPYKAIGFGKNLRELKKKYVELMEVLHQNRKNKGLKDSDADEADRLNSFLKTSSHWLKQMHALEYSNRVLEKNLLSDEYPLYKDPLPLQFRLEQGVVDLTYRLVRANFKKPYPEDRSVLDVIRACYAIPVFQKEGMQLIDDPEVIRFLRLHSEKDNLVVFKEDNLSQIARQMYQILVETVTEIKQLSKKVIAGINKTPIQELEYAFYDINPEECKTLLRKKFQSMLPGINEKHYRQEQKKDKPNQSIRTQETMEDFRREFQKLKEEVFGDLKTTMATAYWLRKMLISTLRNNLSLEKKQRPFQEKEPTKDENGGQNNVSTHILVGTSVTIGDEDISKFNISPDDIISSKMSIQRADHADKWIAVRKSEKTHRLLKMDFFGVIKNFIDKDLNPALQNFGFNEIDLNKQLLPEIQERLVDEQRVNTIRSAILGTVITNLEEFASSTEFHATLRRYFKKPEYDNIHYPEAEKLSLVARDLAHSSTSILQMKYRRVLKVKEEIRDRVKQLQHVLANEVISRRQAEDFQQELKHTRSLLGMLNKVQQIMIFARSSLKDVKLEPENDYVIIKFGEAE